MYRLIILITIAIFINITASAQRCSTDEFIASLKEDQGYQRYLKQLEAIKKIAPEQRSLVCAETIIIPVAVHFNDPITCDDPACLLSAVEAQLNVMNEDFSATNADYSYYEDLNTACPSSYPLSTAPVVGEGSCVQFCLATQNHPAASALVDGDPAITVGQYQWANDAPDWPGYLNIFVDGSQGGLGVAWLPGAGDGDGFWVTPSAFGGPGFTCTSGGTLNNNATYNLGRTATHEAGHYLGLPHVFGSCNDSDSNPPGPIDINDTPPQSNSFFGCPTINSCADVPTDCSNDPQSLFSFMDYTDDPCMVLFTVDQSAVMNWHANNIPFTDNATLCGGSYGDVNCLIPPGPCENGAQDADEQDVDCGGVACAACPSYCGLPFYDEGGPTDSYSNNSLQTWTFCPDLPTQVLTVNFTSFDVERRNATQCWDFLEVYDGPNTAAPQIGGEFCGTTVGEAPGGGSVSASAAGGCLTFLFDSDGSVTPDGWEAEVLCGITLGVDFNFIRLVEKEFHLNLQWSTSSEYNNKGFHVERSRDSKNFQEIAFVEGHNFSEKEINYEYDDNEVESGVVYYYRLKQIDNNGAYKYSNIVSGILDRSNAEHIALFPNPVSSELHVFVRPGYEQNLAFEIRDVQGKKVLVGACGIGESSINLADLPNGIYMARFLQGTRTFASKKIIKM